MPLGRRPLGMVSSWLQATRETKLPQFQWKYYSISFTIIVLNSGVTICFIGCGIMVAGVLSDRYQESDVVVVIFKLLFFKS